MAERKKYQEGGAVEEEEVLTGPAAWGAVSAGRTAVEEEEDLGRAVDLSFLGEAATDPSAGAEAAVDLVRSGELGGLEIPRQEPFSEYPLEPGESRAAQELPEMFMGRRVMDPRLVELEATVADPNLSAWEKMGAMMELRERDEFGVPSTIREGSGLGAGLSVADSALISAAALTMHDPAEIAMMLTQPDPEDPSKRRWPQFGITTAPDGTILVNNTINGTRAMINRPGFSAMDVAQAGALAAAFTPAGRATAAMPSTFGRMAVGATTAGLTEAGIQYGQEAAGGQFDKLDVALSAGIGPAIDVARPVMGLVQRSGRFIGSYIPENFFGIQTRFEGLREVVGQRKAQMLDFVDRMKPFLQSKRPAILTTQDAVPEAHTPFRQLLLKMVERMPLTGTGGLRTRQREQRVETLRWLADRYDLNLNTNYGHTLVNNLNRRAGQQMQLARDGVDAAIEQIGDQDIILRDFRLRIKDMIDAERRHGDLGNQGVINLLNKVRNRIWQGVDTPPGQKFPRDFGTMNDWLEYLYVQAANAPPNARAAIHEVADALKDDLVRHATEQGGDAGARWIRATNQLDDLVRGEETNTLRSLIEAGAVDEQVVRKTIQNGDEELMRTMMQNLTPTGRDNARRMFLQNGLYRSGWRAGPAEELIADPKKFLAWMDNNSDQLRQLWPEGEDLDMLRGLREYLRMTAAAQETGKGIGMAAAGGLGQQAANAMNLITLGAIGAAGNAYQSAPIRNLLLRLYHIKSDPALKDEVMNQITPLLMAGGRSVAQQWDASDEHDMVYASDGLLEAMGRGETSGTTGVSPDLMQQLESAAGGQQEEPSITARLLEMLGMGGDEEEVVVEEP